MFCTLSKTNSFALLPYLLNPFLHIYSFKHTEKKKKILENIVDEGEIAQKEQFHLFQQCFLHNLILKSFHSHISVVVCSFFEFGMVSKWCIRECVKNCDSDGCIPFGDHLRLLKRLQEKEKMLVTSIVSFFENLFHPIKDKFNCLSHIKNVLRKILILQFVVCSDDVKVESFAGPHETQRKKQIVPYLALPFPKKMSGYWCNTTVVACVFIFCISNNFLLNF